MVDWRAKQERLLKKMPRSGATIEASDARVALASNLVRMRSEKGWSQSDLAEKTGMHQPDISDIESGDSNPTVETLGRLAGVLETSVAHLVATRLPREHRVEVNEYSFPAGSHVLSEQESPQTAAKVAITGYYVVGPSPLGTVIRIPQGASPGTAPAGGREGPRDSIRKLALRA